MVTTERQFGILSPILGDREDIPCILLDKAYSPESSNVFMRWGELHRIRGRLKELLDGNNDQVRTPDTNPIIKYHRHLTKAPVTEYLFAFTKANAYIWDSVNKEWDLMFTCSQDCTEWSVESVDAAGGNYKKVIATNGIDLIQVWSDQTPGTAFAPFDTESGLDLGGGSSLTAAKYVTVYEQYVIFAYTTEGGVVYPNRIRWCSHTDETDYDETGTGDTGAADLDKGKGHLKGFGKYGPFLIVFKTHSVRRMWLTEDDYVFNNDEELPNVGLLATDSVVNDVEGRLYWVDNNYNIRELRSGVISAAKDKTLKQINYTYQDYITATLIDEYQLLCWSIPYGDGATGNNKILTYQPENRIWGVFDFAVRAFGDYSRQTAYTIDTIPFDTINTIGWPTIDTVENIVGFPLDLVSDYSGYSWSLHQALTDCGSSFTGSLVITTDLSDKTSLSQYKRINGMHLYFRSEGAGEAIIEAKEDNELNWQSLKTIDLTSEESQQIICVYLPCDLRARHFLLRVSASNSFRFLGVIFDYELDGMR